MLPPYGVGIIMDKPVVLLAKQLHYNWETVVRVHTHTGAGLGRVSRLRSRPDEPLSPGTDDVTARVRP